MSNSVNVNILDRWQDKDGWHCLTLDATGRVRYHTGRVGFWHAIPARRHAILAAERARYRQALIEAVVAARVQLGSDHPLTKQLEAPLLTDVHGAAPAPPGGVAGVPTEVRAGGPSALELAVASIPAATEPPEASA